MTAPRRQRSWPRPRRRSASTRPPRRSRPWPCTRSWRRARSRSRTGSPTTSPSTPSTARARRRSATSCRTGPGSRPCPADLFDLDRIGDREFLSAAIADAKPFVKPGTFLAYHAVSGGFVLAEVVYRATGQTVRDVLRERILAPLGFRWSNYGVSGGEVPAVGPRLHDRDRGSCPRSRPCPGACSARRSRRSSSSPTTRAFSPRSCPAPISSPPRTSCRASLRSSAAAASSTACG